jgi:hypothetical protein
MFSDPINEGLPFIPEILSMKNSLRDRTTVEKKNDLDQWTRRNGVMKYTRSNENENEIARAQQDRLSVIEDVDVVSMGENMEPVVVESEQIVLEDGVNTEKEKEVEVVKEVEEEVEVEVINMRKFKEKEKEKKKEKDNDDEVEKEKKRREINPLHPLVIQDRDDDVAIIVSPKAPSRPATHTKAHTKARSRSKKPQTPKSPLVIFRTSPRPVEQLDMFTKEVVRRYESHGHACRLMNIQRTVMTQCCANQMLSAGNFSWRESLIVSSKGKGREG